MRVLFWISTFSFFPVMTVAFFSGYLFVYESNLRLYELAWGMPWEPFIIYPLAVAAIAFLIALILRKKTPFLKTSGIGIIIINLSALLASVAYGSESYFQTKHEYLEMLSERLKEAESDVQNGHIVFNSYGFPATLSEDMARGEKEVDSLRESFGISYANQGCMITDAMLKVDDEYKKYVTPYLDKRNGKGWEKRLETEIQQIRNRYR